MSYLLDTCVLSELRKTVPIYVREWFESKDESLLFISAITLAEIWDGIERLPQSKKKKDLEDWFYGAVLSRFKDRILFVDDKVAIEWGNINALLKKKGKCMGVQDLYIAATAKVNSLALVTINIKDFQMIEIPLFNPWSES